MKSESKRGLRIWLSEQEKKKPNIIVILTEGWQRNNRMNHLKKQTTNMPAVLKALTMIASMLKIKINERKLRHSKRR